MNKDLSRQDRILGVIVSSYVETAEPVGSGAISKRSGLGLSSASIRNTMADLEGRGFLTQPHTSAGRVPTDKGYRYYVDHLMTPEDLSEKEKDWVAREIGKVRSVDQLADKVSKVISTLTDNAGMIYIKNLKRVSFLTHLLDELVQAQRIAEFLEEEPELFIEGVFRMFEQPEFQDAQKIRLLLKAFDEKDDFLEILSGDLELEGVQVHIGSENPADELEDVSLVVKDYYLGKMPIGGIAAVGPTRMKYPKVVSVVDFVADTVSQAVNRY